MIKDGKTVGMLFGSFDIFHTGYAMMIQEASEMCDKLIVGLQTVAIHKDLVNSAHERWMVLRNVRGIDEIALYDTELELINLLSFFKPDIRFLGDDYRPSGFENKSFSTARYSVYLKESVVGFEKCPNIVFINRDHKISSSRVKSKIIANYNEKCYRDGR
tara:strand:- start:626 stop:1105 length:480 start_codon:yes stop_codon:yes gene_type:complete